MEIMNLPLDTVEEGTRRRPVASKKVGLLMVSMGQRGQMTPIEVQRSEDVGHYRLVSGAHRLAACRALGLKTVIAIVLEDGIDEIDIQLREIDENLYRNELSPYDQAVFISARAELWEKKYGHIKQGRSKNPQVAGFAKETAAKFGLSEDIVERARVRMKTLAPIWASLRGTEIAETGAYMDKLRSLDADKQRAVIRMVCEDGVSFNVAHASVRGGVTQKATNPRAECDKLVRLWNSTSDAGRELFRKHIRGTKKRDGLDEAA